MKTKISLLAASISLALTAGVAQAEGPIDGKVYGKINVTLQSSDEGTDSRVTELQSNASRFGFKGKTKIDDSLSAIYQIEYQVNADNGSTLSQRNTYVGLQGNFGTVKAGNIDTPTKLAQGKVDLFNDYEGDMGRLFSGEVRAKNTVYYTTPDMGGLEVDFALIASEVDGIDDGFSTAVKFNQDGLYAALAYDLDVEGEGKETIRLVGSYKIQDLTLGAIWSQYKVEGQDNQDGFLLSAAYKMGSNTFKLQHATSDIKAEGGEQTSLGMDHKLGKNTKVFGFYTMQDADAANSDKNWLAVGLEHSF